MKIRSVCLSVDLEEEDFIDPTKGNLISKLRRSKKALNDVSSALSSAGYDVQTMRISLNCFNEWNPTTDLTYFTILGDLIFELGIQFCAFGGTMTHKSFTSIPSILSISPAFNCTINMVPQSGPFTCCPDTYDCLSAAQVCLEVAETLGDLGNFRFSVSFNCRGGTPFFPASFRESQQPSNLLSVGLENGALLFLSFFGADSLNEGSANLYQTLRQVLKPLDTLLEEVCRTNCLHYGGIDASINPGLALSDSVGAGIEHALNILSPADEVTPSTPSTTTPAVSLRRKFGCSGTLAVVSAITAALKALRERGDVKLVGYCGLMLPVMEDIVLAQVQTAEDTPLASKNTSTDLRIRDLILFSSVCGVGIDTVPISLDEARENLQAVADVYMELGTVAFRLNKPLSCRLLPMKGKTAGDQTEVDSPHLCNTRVFSLS